MMSSPVRQAAWKKIASSASAVLGVLLAVGCGGPAQPPSAGQAFDAASLTAALQASAVDVTPPSAPSNLVWTNTGMTVTLGWGASTDDVGVVAYDFYYGSFFIGSTTETLATLIGFRPSTPYNFTVRARDAAGNLSVASNQITVLVGPIVDSWPPSGPSNLKASNVTATSLTLSWTASTDDVGVVMYQIRRDGATAANTFGTTSATITGLTPSTQYSFTVLAMDAAGNLSLASAALVVTTAAAPDTVPPSVPTGLVASGATTSSITLSWAAASDNVAVTGYDVLSSGAVVASSADTSATVTGLSAGTSYAFSVRAKDGAGNLSSASAQVTASTQADGFTLTLGVSGSGTTSPAAGTYRYAAGSTVTVTAIPSSGYAFQGWTAVTATTTNPLTFTMNGNINLSAIFAAIPRYTLTIAVSGNGTTSPAPGTYTYTSGSSVNVTAVPASNTVFTGWSGDASGTSNTVAIVVNGNKSVTAGFSSNQGSSLVGWATVNGTVTGGGNASPVTVTTLSALNSAVGGTTAAVVYVSGTISGDVTVGSNKTIIGSSASATIHGHVELKGSSNVIVRNLNVVGYNCTDNSDCQSGADAMTVVNGAHHLLFDHLAVSDGSDGNLDVTHAADNVTIAWTKFFYSGSRSGGHQFSNLIGHSDSNASEDTTHLNVTFHHCWWAQNVGERMPRVRFGKVHVFNSLYTASGNNYAIAAGNSANVLAENNVFIGISDPIDFTHGDSSSIGTMRGNIFTSCSGNTTGQGTAFTPPYSYTLDAASSVESAVRAGAGPK